MLKCATWLLALLPVACEVPVVAPEVQPPNVVLILADDMGYGDPSCNNPDSKIRTPNLDRIANEGLRFTDAHSPASWCTPTRFGLLTGKYPFRHGRKWGQRCIAPDQGTLATMLRDRGYATGMVGKWHLWFDGKKKGRDWQEPIVGGPVDCGFDSYFGIPASLDIPPYYYIRGNRPVVPPLQTVAAGASADGWTKIQGAFWRKGGIAEGFRHENVMPDLTREAVAFLDQRGRDASEPFFLYFALPAPHTPWLPLAKYRGRSAASMYGDFVAQVDDSVGAVLAALDRHGLSENTIVIFTSDNGPVWYPKDVERYGHRSVGPLRGMKSDAWEGGHRMPFFVRWPRATPKGGVRDRLICFTDVMATLADVTGAKVPSGAGEDSVSFAVTLRGGTTAPRGPTVLKANATVLRDGRYKLITQLGSGGFSSPRRVPPQPGGPTGQLYDLEADLGETTNLWQKRPEVVRRMVAQLQALTGK